MEGAHAAVGWWVRGVQCGLCMQRGGAGCVCRRAHPPPPRTLSRPAFEAEQLQSTEVQVEHVEEVKVTVFTRSPLEGPRAHGALPLDFRVSTVGLGVVRFYRRCVVDGAGGGYACMQQTGGGPTRGGVEQRHGRSTGHRFEIDASQENAVCGSRRGRRLAVQVCPAVGQCTHRVRDNQG